MECQLFLLYMLVLCANSGVVVSYPQPLKEEQQNDILQPLGFSDSQRFLQPAGLFNSQGLSPQVGNSPVEWLNFQRLAPQLGKQPAEWLNSQRLSPQLGKQPAEWLNSQRLSPQLGKQPAEWLNSQRLSPQLGKQSAEWSNSQRSPSQVKNPPVEWLNSKGLSPQLANSPVGWLNSQGSSLQLGNPPKGLSSELRNPPAQWLNSRGLSPQYQSAGVFQGSPQPLEITNTQKQPQQAQYVNYNTPNNGLQGFKENLQEQRQIDQRLPQRQQYPIFAKPKVVNNNYQEQQFVVVDNQGLPKQYSNELAWSSNVHNSLQNYEKAKPQRPFTPIINNDLEDKQYLRPTVPPIPVNNFKSSDQPKSALNQRNDLTLSSPGNMQVSETSYHSTPPTEPQYVIEPIAPADPSYDPVVNKIVALDTDSYNPILQNNRSQTASEKDNSTSHHKRYIVVHKNETLELIDSLNDIVVDDLNIAHIKTNDGLNPILAVIEVEDKMTETEDESPSNLPYDTGISNIPQDDNWNTNDQSIPDNLPQNPVSNIKMVAEENAMKYFSPEYIMPIESTTQYNENVGTKNDTEQATKTNISYLKPEYVIPLKPTTENSIDNSTDTDLLTSEYNEKIYSNNFNALQTGGFDINKLKSEYFIPTEPTTTTNRVRSATYTAQLTSKDNNPDALSTTEGIDSRSEYIMPTEPLTKYSYYSANALKSTVNRGNIDADPYTTQEIEYSDKNDDEIKYVMTREFANRENSINDTTITPKYIGNTDFANGHELYYDPETTPTNTISPLDNGPATTPLSSIPPPLIEMNGQSTTVVNLSNDPATTANPTFADGMKKYPETEYLDDNEPINRAYRKLKDEYGIDATSDLKPEIDKSYIWFRPDENFLDKLVNGENPYKTVVIYDVNCQPTVIERETTVHHFPNGTKVIDYVETVWDKPSDLNPREVKTHKMVMNLDE